MGPREEAWGRHGITAKSRPAEEGCQERKMPGAGDGRCHSVPEEQQEICEDQDGPTNRTMFKEMTVRSRVC